MAKGAIQLTSGTDYALRGLLYLAKQPEGRLVVASEIAEAEKMPEFFFSKIFQNLARAGIIHSVRGNSGGFSLAKPSTDITILETIEAIEGSISISKCVDDPASCEKSGTCPFHKYLEEGKGALASVLKQYTLADALKYYQENQAPPSA